MLRTGCGTGQRTLVQTRDPLRRGGVRTVRGLLRYLPFYRAFVAIEFSLLVLVAATIDAAQGSLVGSRVLLVALCPIAVLVVVGHLISILASNRLR